jgi:hypothetical protein
VGVDAAARGVQALGAQHGLDGVDLRRRCSAANSAWSKAMSVSRPAESRARVTPGTSRSTRAAAWRRRRVWACRVAASSWYIFDSKLVTFRRWDLRHFLV